MQNLTESHVFKMMEFFRNIGLDQDGTESLRKQEPFWKALLDNDYMTPEYSFTLTFVKKIYRVFRNENGKHIIEYKDDNR